jgi:acyl dehydratase
MATVDLPDIAGHDLGRRTVRYDDRDAILYALAVGAPPDRLDLVYERDLRVLPTLATALGLWAVEAAGDLGAYDRTRSLHVSQRLEMLQPLPPTAAFDTTGHITNVWDKTKAAMVDIEVRSDYFTASYSIFLPGLGGWGGERGPSTAAAEAVGPSLTNSYTTSPNHAALYRLTGDRHPIHIDPEVAKLNGFDRPILHGLCTLGIAARLVAETMDAHPADLTTLEARLAAPVLPGDCVEVDVQRFAPDQAAFEARVGDATVLSNGLAHVRPLPG